MPHHRSESVSVPGQPSLMQHLIENDWNNDES